MFASKEINLNDIAVHIYVLHAHRPYREAISFDVDKYKQFKYDNFFSVNKITP